MELNGTEWNVAVLNDQIYFEINNEFKLPHRLMTFKNLDFMVFNDTEWNVF